MDGGVIFNSHQCNEIEACAFLEIKPRMQMSSIWAHTSILSIMLKRSHKPVGESLTNCLFFPPSGYYWPTWHEVCKKKERTEEKEKPKDRREKWGGEKQTKKQRLSFSTTETLPNHPAANNSWDLPGVGRFQEQGSVLLKETPLYDPAQSSVNYNFCLITYSYWEPQHSFM